MSSFFKTSVNSIKEFFESFRRFDVYTDGSSKDGMGSWAFVVTKRGRNVFEKSGTVRGANSNTMEFRAAIEALQFLAEGSKLTLISDSRILVDTMKSGEGPRAHQDQIEVLVELEKKRQVTWRWIKAHRGHQFNERCDELCLRARTEPVDSGPLSPEPRTEN